MLLPPSQLHKPCCCTPHSCIGHIAVPLIAVQPCHCLPYSCTRMFRSYMGHVTTPLASAHAALPHASHLHGHITAYLTAIQATSQQALWLNTLYCSRPHSWMHYIAAGLTVGHTMLQHTLWLDAPYYSPHCSHTHHITTHQAAARATLLSLSQLHGHITASLAAAHIATWAMFLHVPSSI